MRKFNKVLLEVKDFNKPVNSMIFHLADLLDIQKLYFYQIILNNEEQKTNDYINTKDKYFKELVLHVKDIFPSVSQIQFDFLVFNNEPVKEILKASIKLDIDLIVCEYGAGILKREDIIKVSKNSYCNVLVLPENGNFSEVQKILVPVDFSEYSRKALDCALEMTTKRKIAVILNHVFFVQPNYLSTGKSYEESATIEKQMAKKECQRFLKEYNADDLNISYSYILDDDKDPTDKIFKDALDCNADLIVLGSKGKTNSTEVLTGSIAFSILLYNQQVPMMIIKNKKVNYDLAEEYIINM